jgi:hypothetical protein
MAVFCQSTFTLKHFNRYNCLIVTKSGKVFSLAHGDAEVSFDNNSHDIA